CPHPDGGAVRDFGEAYRWLSRVAEECPEEGLRDVANLLIARMYYQGEGTLEGQDYRRAFERHVLSESIPYSAAQEAFMRKMGFGCDYDFEAIERYYQRIIDSGDVIARLELARFYESHGMYGKAESAYLSMDPISIDGHYGVGMLYATGNHASPPSPDFARASFHLQQAADGGHVRAMVELGHLYFRPTGGFTKNFRKAMGCYERAARLGDMTAQYMMGYMLEYGHVRRDIEESIRYFELAAAKGHILSSEHLAMLYQLPEVCNYSLAFKHCKVAADGGDSHAEFMLGNMLLFGRGCAYDVDAAKRYYLRAISHGYTPAQQMLDVLVEHDQEGASSRPSWL
ncbi:MAG: sel1 repeat family protein, partial [Atopobiaceae bacterium]|nr:sel1 repeat family protein [Atopobiaceae bacterium]